MKTAKDQITMTEEETREAKLLKPMSQAQRQDYRLKMIFDSKDDEQLAVITQGRYFAAQKADYTAGLPKEKAQGAWLRFLELAGEKDKDVQEKIRRFEFIQSLPFGATREAMSVLRPAMLDICRTLKNTELGNLCKSLKSRSINLKRLFDDPVKIRKEIRSLAQKELNKLLDKKTPDKKTPDKKTPDKKTPITPQVQSETVKSTPLSIDSLAGLKSVDKRNASLVSGIKAMSFLLEHVSNMEHSDIQAEFIPKDQTAFIVASLNVLIENATKLSRRLNLVVQGKASNG
jgi:hypothetical protein